MRLLKKINNSRRVVGVVLIHSTDDNKPKYALVLYAGGNPDDAQVIMYNGESIPIASYGNACTIEEVKPSEGAGLIRRTAQLSIVTDGPFSLATQWVAQYYSAGANSDSFYFSIWQCDAYEGMRDLLKYGVCLGKFQLDSGSAWNESDTTTTVNLIDVSMNFEDKLNYYSQESTDKLIGTELEGMLSMPMHIGNGGLVPMTMPKSGPTQTGSSGNAIAVYSGFVTKTVGSPIHSIYLGRSQFLADNVGSVVKFVMRSGETIITSLSVDGDEYYATGLNHNQAFHPVGVTANVANSPVDSQLAPNSLRLSSGSDVPVNNMFIRVPVVNFLNSGPGNTAVTNKVIRMTGLLSRATNAYSIADVTHSSSAYRTVPGVYYSSADTNTDFTGTADVQFNKASQYTISSNSELFFRNPTVPAAAVVAGDSWTVYVTASVNNTLVRSYTPSTGFLRVIGTNITAVYIKIGGLPTLLPTSGYTITLNTTFTGIDRVAKVVLTKTYDELFPGQSVDSSQLYVTLRATYKVDSLINKVITQLQPDAMRFFGNRIRKPAPSDSPGPVVCAAISVDDTLSSFLDSLLYETGCTLKWRPWRTDGQYLLELEDAVNTNLAMLYWKVSGQAFARPLCRTKIDNSEVVDGSYSINVGKLDTTIDSVRHTESLGAYVRGSYVYNRDSGATIYGRSVRTRNRRDRYKDYTFRYICDQQGLGQAVQLMLRPGHGSGLMETTRVHTIRLGFNRSDIEANDIIDIRRFKFISDSVDPSGPITIDSNGGTYYSYDDAHKYILLPNITIVDSVKITMTPSEYGVDVILKQVQIGTYPTLLYGDKYNVVPNTANVGEVSANPEDLPPIDPGEPSAHDNPSIDPPLAQCGHAPVDTPVPPPVEPPGDDAPVGNGVDTTDHDACTPSLSRCDATTTTPGGTPPPSVPQLGAPCPQQEYPDDFSPMIDLYFVPSSISPWSFPVGLVAKADGFAIIGGGGGVTIGPDCHSDGSCDPTVTADNAFDVSCVTGSISGGITIPASAEVIGSASVAMCAFDPTVESGSVYISGKVVATWVDNRVSGATVDDLKYLSATVSLNPLGMFTARAG